MLLANRVCGALGALGRFVGGLTPLQIAEEIRKDKIDILVELGGHSAGACVMLAWKGGGKGRLQSAPMTPTADPFVLLLVVVHLIVTFVVAVLFFFLLVFAFFNIQAQQTIYST